MAKWRALCWKLHRNLPSRAVGVVIRNLHYDQGQATKEYTREYFYFIDHQGMLFLDDSRMKNFTSCFKEKKFLEFFFRRLRYNDTGNEKSPPTHFDWDGTRYELSNSLLPVINKVSSWNGTE
ncbi:hypothetical protein MTO96_011844 [Rhipicephalus appendiculatus]